MRKPRPIWLRLATTGMLFSAAETQGLSSQQQLNTSISYTLLLNKSIEDSRSNGNEEKLMVMMRTVLLMVSSGVAWRTLVHLTLAGIIQPYQDSASPNFQLQKD